MFGRKNKQTETATPVPARSAPAGTTAAPVATGKKAKGDGKVAYETRRAEKAGMGLEKWMAEKDRRARAERDAIAQARRKSDADRQTELSKPGLLRRLLDRAHRPI